MTTFHTLNLRKSPYLQEQTLAQRSKAKERKKAYLKELLIQNFLKRYSLRLQPEANTPANSVMIARLVSAEIEQLMAKEQLTQKGLRGVDREVERILQGDEKIGPYLLKEGRRNSQTAQYNNITSS